MLTILGALSIGFLWGIRRGASSCLALCIPSIMPTLVEERGTWKKGLKIALWFNAPRVLLLTLLGAAIGAGGYIIREGVEEFAVGSTIWAAGYGIVGCLMIVYGTFIFATISERLEEPDEPRGDENGACDNGMLHPLLARFDMVTPKTRTGLFLWGGLVSIACIGETVLAIETIFVGIFTAELATSPIVGAVLGGLAFFIFGLGTALPSVLIASFSTTLADKEKQMTRLLRIQKFSGIMMICFGGILVMAALFFI
ncbi:MAG: hypothetical protein KAS67_00080 [Thermoplasmata archaeon]|nr:hypothetical protein [Thermoplasmata archaeon]